MLYPFFSHEDSFLDAILDELTVNPYTDLTTALARVEHVQAAESKVERVEQRKAELQEERAARLRCEWASVTNDRCDTSKSGLQSCASLDALTTRSSAYLDSLVCATNREVSTSSRGALGISGSPASLTSFKLAAEALSPLISALSRPPDGDDHVTSALRSAYVRLLPYILAVAPPPATPSTTPSCPVSSATTVAGAACGGPESVQLWYALHTGDSSVRALLSPYMNSVVGSLERELRFHFSVGRETAVVHEPQHFFVFLIDCYQRQQSITREHWATSTLHDSASDAALRLLQWVSQVVLSATAVVVFQDCYGWRPSSPLLRHNDYVVVTVNAVLDFVASAEGRVCRGAVQLLAGHMLWKEVLQLYAECGADMALAALRDGTVRLWRRSFLMEGASRASFPLYTRSLSLVRSLEAFQRRLLNSLLVLRGSWAEVVWRSAVEPALSVFLSIMEQQGAPALSDAAAVSWDSVLSLQWCVASVQVVAAAAEDWFGMLRESCAATASTASSPSPSQSEPLDALMLFRDQLIRCSAERAQHLIRQICTHHPGYAAQAARLLHGAEEFLQHLERLPDGVSTGSILQDVMQHTLQKGLSLAHRDELLAYANKCGLRHFAQLLLP